jgi:hypothetical protein
MNYCFVMSFLMLIIHYYSEHLKHRTTSKRSQIQFFTFYIELFVFLVFFIPKLLD